MEEVIDDTPPSFSPYEDIAACAMAMDCIEGLDELLMSREDAELIREIKTMTLRIIHTGIKEIYETNFYASENNKSS